jgi:hypothetical protein
MTKLGPTRIASMFKTSRFSMIPTRWSEYCINRSCTNKLEIRKGCIEVIL